jgi:hypothetical protein
MKRLNYTIFLMTLIIAMLSGCAQMGSGGTFDCPDADNDGICNQYEKNGSSDNLGGDTTPVECKKDDGSIVYLDCSLTTDCNCNKIDDGEEAEMTKGCGWGCVSGNARTWVMVATAMVGAYIAGQYVHWPFWNQDPNSPTKDAKGQVIDYVAMPSDPEALKYDKSELYIYKDEAKQKIYMKIHVESFMQSQQNGLIYCNTDLVNEVNSISNIAKLTIDDPFISPMTYSMDLTETPVFQKQGQYIKVNCDGIGEKYVKDPNWLGLKVASEGTNSTTLTLTGLKQDGQGEDYYQNLNFIYNGFSDQAKFAMDPLAVNNLNIQQSKQGLLYEWKRSN